MNNDLGKKEIELIAVSKTRSIEEMLQLIEWGQREFGENRLEEINRKAKELPKDVRWHLIGPLQGRKVKEVGRNITLFHALDRLKIWKKLNDHMEDIDHQIDVLIQVHIAREDSKHGFSLDEVRGIFEQNIHLDFPRTHVIGLMGMATFTDDEAIIRSEFDQLKALFDEISHKYYSQNSDSTHRFTKLSMGMSADYNLAIKSGSTMVRIGSMLFK